MMKVIGLIGGMSYESTIPYYKIINEVVNKSLGRLHSAKCLLYSVDFEEIEKCQSSGNWGESARILSDAAISLEKAGAEFIVICTNTMHKVAPEIQSAVGIPLLHIATPTINSLRKNGVKKAGLLGTKYTMEQDFYKSKLLESGIEIVVPDKADREKVNDIIFNELCRGVIKDESRQTYLKIINDLVKKGAEGIVLGCTEIGLLIKEGDADVPLFDTTLIHAESAALYSINNDFIKTI